MPARRAAGAVSGLGGRLAGASAWTPISLDSGVSCLAAQALVTRPVRDLGRLREL